MLHFLNVNYKFIILILSGVIVGYMYIFVVVSLKNCFYQETQTTLTSREIAHQEAELNQLRALIRQHGITGEPSSPSTPY